MCRNEPATNVAYILERSNPEITLEFFDLNSVMTLGYSSFVTSLIQMLETRSKHFVNKALLTFQERSASGLLEDECFTSIGVELCLCAEYHSHLLIAKSFQAGVASLEGDSQFHPDANEVAVVRKLLLLHLVQRVLEDSGPFLISRALPISSLESLSAFRSSIITAIAPHALNLIEGYQFSDKRLDSVLGRRDGNVYPYMMETCKAEPLNHGAAAEGQKYIMQMLLSKNSRKDLGKAHSPKSRL